MADKYPGISPLNTTHKSALRAPQELVPYCAWNPLKLIDPDGKENVIYVVNLQGKNGNIDVDKLVENINIRLKDLGLETRAQLAPDGVNFNPKFMDKTDSYVAIGSVDDVKNFISNNSQKQYQSFDNWLGGTSNPERSSNYYHRKGDIVAIDANAIAGAAAYFNKDKDDMSTFLVLHGLGHNAGFNHSGETGERFEQSLTNAAIMVGGQSQSWIRNRSFDFIMGKYNNSRYVSRIKEVFGNNKSQSNYVSKKNQALYKYICY